MSMLPLCCPRNMAASSLNAVRVRLYFDYPPPGMPDCRMSWVLVDLNKCRVVADLCSVIREKFDYSRKTVLDLFIENCFLPPAESIHVVRDNDSIRVKVSGVSSEHVGKKRRRDEEGLIPIPTKKNKHAATETNGFLQPAGVTKKKKKLKAKKKKREGQQGECRDYVKAAVPAKESSSYKSQTDKSTNKASSASSCLTNEKASSSGTYDKSSDSSDSSEKVPQNFSPNKSKRCAQVTASKRPAVRKFSFSGDKDENVPVKKSPKSTTRTSGKTPKRSTSSLPPNSATNSTAVKETQAESSSDLASSQDEASAGARKANFPAKSVSVQQKSTTATSKAKPQTVTTSSSEEDSESSTERESQVLQKSTSSSSKSVSSLQTQPTSSKISTSIKPSKNPKTSKSQTSSGSSSSSEDEACDTSLPTTPKPLKMAPALCAAMENSVTPIPSTPVGTMLQNEEEKAERSDLSSSSSDTELVIKKPNPQLMIGLTPRGRGRGFTDRVKSRGGVRGGFGRARGTPWKQNLHYSYDTEEQRQRKDIQTNQSLLLQNPPERDYSTLPLLAAAPAVGQKIAFKLLELTENYTPEVSDYKEGKIISFNHSTNVIELELLTLSQARTEPGKFDLVYQDPDGFERVEYAVTFGSQLTERWESLLEPRLIVQNTD